jgi:hydroxymethylpyrimidine pyrophosphatase-like HAD family hydrolase
MRYIVFATDYDGTLATDGRVDRATVAALEKLRASGRKLILATGRHLGDLKNVFDAIDIFDRIVAENGAVLYHPASREEKVLAEPPSADFLAALREAEVTFAAGRVIVSSWTPDERRILEVIRKLALDYQVIFNKGAVMVLPSGVNKATGLRAALDALQLSLHNTLAIGDAENDHAFLAASECSVAVANSVAALQTRADIVTKGARGEGAVEIIDELLDNDLQPYDEKLERSSISLGTLKSEKTAKIRVSPNRTSVLVAGASGSGKSSAVAGILEEMTEKGYQFCLIDPEGDFEQVAGAVSIGTNTQPPHPDEVAKALSGSQSLIVNFLGVPVKDRPNAFASLLPKVMEARSQSARPHWLVIDEAHHLLPSSAPPVSGGTPQDLSGAILITVHPEHVAQSALVFVDVALAMGEVARATLQSFSEQLHIPAPSAGDEQPGVGEALVWRVRRNEPPEVVVTPSAKAQRRRHRRNYAQGELSPEQSFYFRGPESKLNLRAQNLMTFLQLSEGVDDETWLFHLRRGDYSHWFQTVIKDDDLAASAHEIESSLKHNAAQGRSKLREAVECRYTASA